MITPHHLQFAVLFVCSFLFGRLLSAESGNGIEFDYSNGPNGPEHWGDLSPEWKFCKTGRQQSPIVIKRTKVQPRSDLGDLPLDHKRNDAVLHVGGHDVGVDWEDNGGIFEITSEQYELKQFHLHSPSEHIIDRIRFPLELHMVYQTSNGKIAVISILYRYGRKDKFLGKFTDRLYSMVRNNQTDVRVRGINVGIMNFGKSYYRYEGSLTTPPCSEGVIWTIMKKKRTVTEEQVKAIQAATVGLNARPLQALNGRPILSY